MSLICVRQFLSCYVFVWIQFGFQFKFTLFVVVLFLGRFLLLHSLVFSGHFGSLCHGFRSDHPIFTIKEFFISNKNVFSSFGQLVQYLPK